MTPKREIILHTAMRLFTEQGFHATPTSKIAKAAGVATGTLFHHFENKEALINELYIYVKRRLRQSLAVGLDTEATFKTQLFTLWKNDIYWFKDHYEEFVFIQQFCHSNLIMDSTRELLYNDFTDYTRLFESAIARGELKSDDLEYTLSNYVANVQQNNMHFRNHPECLNDATVAQHFEIYWSGISL